MAARAGRSLLAALQHAVPRESVLVEQDAVRAFRVDWLGQSVGPWLEGRTPCCVLRPRSTREVSAMLRLCSEHGVPVVPQGGNTGLVGGSVPSRGDEVVLSLSRLDQVLSFDGAAGAVSVQAGCVLDALGAFLRERGHCAPLDLGSSGSCQVGGNLSTHAGGLRVVRYGPLRASVLGLEVVLADGRVLDLQRALRKDNTGYDLKQLFLGAEGTLGVITAATLLCPPLPRAQHVALVGLRSYAEVLAALAAARDALGEVLSAIEFWDGASMALVRRRCGLRDPLGDGSAPFYLLIETSGSNAAHDREKLLALLERFALGVLAEDHAKARQLWAIRESITLALKQSGGHTFKYDVSLAPSLIDRATQLVATRLKDTQASVFQYGHVGDGNLHLNVWNSTYDAVSWWVGNECECLSCRGLACNGLPACPASASMRRCRLPSLLVLPACLRCLFSYQPPCLSACACLCLCERSYSPLTTLPSARAHAGHQGCDRGHSLRVPARGERQHQRRARHRSAQTARARSAKGKSRGNVILGRLRGCRTELNPPSLLASNWLRQSPLELEIMRGLKRLLDPHNILNPGKVLAAPAESHAESSAEPAQAGAPAEPRERVRNH